MDRRKNIVIVRLSISLVVIGVLLYFAPLREIYKELAKVTLSWFFISLFLAFLGTVISSLRLQLFSHIFSQSISFLQVLRSYTIGNFFNAFFPTSIGGDIMKINELRKVFKNNTGGATISVILDRVSGLAVVFLILLFLLAVYRDAYFVLLGNINFLLVIFWVLFLSIAITLICIILWKKVISGFAIASKLRWILIDISQAFSHLRSNRRYITIIGSTTCLSLFFHIIRVLVLIVLVRAVGGELAFFTALAIIVILTFINILPVSLGGLGINEAFVVYTLIRVGISPPEAYSVALLMRVGFYLNAVIGAIWYIKSWHVR